MTTHTGFATFIPASPVGLGVLRLLDLIQADNLDGETMRPIFNALHIDLDKAVVAYAWWVDADYKLHSENESEAHQFYILREDAFDAVRALATAIQPEVAP